MVSSPIRTQELSSLEPKSSFDPNSVERQDGRLQDSAAIAKPPGKSSAPSSWGSLALPETRLFGTDGIRGRVGDFLTAPLAMQVGFWAGKVLQAEATQVGSVVIGQDSRNSSNLLAMALSAGLTASGLEVWDLGLCPTPCVAHLTNSTDAIGGVMISASHNPPEDNGIKFFGAQGSCPTGEN
jgi:phosphoglucosamine mutase